MQPEFLGRVLGLTGAYNNVHIQLQGKGATLIGFTYAQSTSRGLIWTVGLAYPFVTMDVAAQTSLATEGSSPL